MKRWYSKEDLIKASQCRYVFVASPRGYGIVQFLKDLAERRKKKIMKYYTRLNTADGHKAVAVEGRKCPYCETAFTYKDERGIYRLVDIDTGLSICSAQKNKDLKPFYDRVKEWYELTKKKHSYQTQVHNFEMLKKATQNAEFGKETTKDA